MKKFLIILLIGSTFFISLACSITNQITFNLPQQTKPTASTFPTSTATLTPLPTATLFKPTAAPTFVPQKLTYGELLAEPPLNDPTQFTTDKVSYMGSSVTRWIFRDIDINQDIPFQYTIYKPAIDDVVMSIDTDQILDNEVSLYGFICRYQNADNYYFLSLVADKNIAIFKIQDGQWTPLINWDVTRMLPRHVGQTLNIKGSCIGNKISLWNEDQLLGQATDNTFKDGRGGFFTNLAAKDEPTIKFDHFQLLKHQIETATITPTRQKTSTPMATPSGWDDDPLFPVGALLEEDDFEFDRGGWEGIEENAEGAITYYQGGLWSEVKYPNSFRSAISNSSKYLNNVYLSADVDLTKPVEGSYFALLCRYQDKDNYYFFGFSKEKFISIQKMINGRATPLINWSYSSYIPDNHSMTIQAGCVGSKLSIGVNGILLGEVNEDTLAHGRVGLSVGTGPKGNFYAAYNHFSVYLP